MENNSASDSERSGNEEQNPSKTKKQKKKEKRGIIYLSTIPRFMNVTKVREIFGEYGEIDRVFMQPEEIKGKRKTKKKPAKHFTEGWIEFKKKRVAKQVAALLNNKQVGGRKRSKFYDFIWNIKYLPRFKWVHLSERLAYERAVYKQRMNTEISQAKREANFFSQNVDLSERLAKRREREKDSDVDKKSGVDKKSDIDEKSDVQETSSAGKFVRQYKQRDLDDEIRSKKLRNLEPGSITIKKKNKNIHRKQANPSSHEDRQDFLKSIFGSRT